VEVPNDDSIKTKGFSFMGIDEIKKLDQCRAVDIIGIICAVDSVNLC